ncbi:uncharacterized protein TRIVIDRAFT_209282 [Trichoderma virens Gv29-8]|uniref:Uncharacterized protein n=1 Tax=Hypocrea virens (strain Gv29-8 / FGSC 10586) TaxID=413071 RepID=G9MRY2_HYPVG|nr:uncharacterized protein TRIVIDRAFT_209282 [Trichoderma virens Gv29-8]EHK22850.1 hypothetical protein TRIVIDRAFT_209282 [Trichoderma virens Gv29-8]
MDSPVTFWEPAATHLRPTNWLALPLTHWFILGPWASQCIFPAICPDMRHLHKYGMSVDDAFRFLYQFSREPSLHSGSSTSILESTAVDDWRQERLDASSTFGTQVHVHRCLLRARLLHCLLHTHCIGGEKKLMAGERYNTTVNDTWRANTRATLEAFVAVTNEPGDNAAIDDAPSVAGGVLMPRPPCCRDPASTGKTTSPSACRWAAMPLNYEQAKGWLAGGLQEARASQPWTNNPGFTPGLFVNGRSSMPFTDLVFNDIPSPDEGRKAAESEQSPERTARKPKGDIDRQNEIEFLDNPLRCLKQNCPPPESSNTRNSRAVFTTVIRPRLAGRGTTRIFSQAGYSISTPISHSRHSRNSECCSASTTCTQTTTRMKLTA